MADMRRYKRHWDPATRRWVYEHREVAAANIDRPLSSSDIVHHKDKDFRNNNPDNLVVITKAAHMSIHMRRNSRCKICERVHHAKGLCNAHYMAWLRAEGRAAMR